MDHNRSPWGRLNSLSVIGWRRNKTPPQATVTHRLRSHCCIHFYNFYYYYMGFFFNKSSLIILALVNFLWCWLKPQSVAENSYYTGKKNGFWNTRKCLRHSILNWQFYMVVGYTCAVLIQVLVWCVVWCVFKHESISTKHTVVIQKMNSLVIVRSALQVISCAITMNRK